MSDLQNYQTEDSQQKFYSPEELSSMDVSEIEFEKVDPSYQSLLRKYKDTKEHFTGLNKNQQRLKKDHEAALEKIRLYEEKLSNSTTPENDYEKYVETYGEEGARLKVDLESERKSRTALEQKLENIEARIFAKENAEEISRIRSIFAERFPDKNVQNQLIDNYVMELKQAVQDGEEPPTPQEIMERQSKGLSKSFSEKPDVLISMIKSSPKLRDEVMKSLGLSPTSTAHIASSGSGSKVPVPSSGKIERLKDETWPEYQDRVVRAKMKIHIQGLD
jgi:chromosome segregation ATPase